jgi:hypothetical protein
MKISSSAMSLNSQQIDIKNYSRNESLKYWDGNNRIEYSESVSQKSLRALFEKKDIVELTRAAQDAFDKNFLNPASDKLSETNGSLVKQFGEDFIADAKLRLIKDLIEHLTGKKITIYGDKKEAAIETGNGNPESNSAPQETSGQNPSQNSEGWGLDYSYSEQTYTKEGFLFAASGTVTTETGEKISVSAVLETSREYAESINVSIKAGDALKDPLVINFDGLGAQLGDSIVLFDLNSDAKIDSFNFLKQGSGFLAIDKNENGTVDNGTELFGPSTNDGFKELSAFDSDKNSWIDENDPVFSALRIWEKNENGADIISTLKEKNIGAIFLNRATTGFSLLNSAGTTGGVLKETGLYLSENGKPGYIQELDIVI